MAHFQAFLLSTFHKLGLSDSLLSALDQLGFVQPTEIQQKAIPFLLGEQDRDFIGLAQTGTGKTAAFSLPLIEITDLGIDQIQAVVLSPTRELAQQTAKEIQTFTAKLKGFRSEIVYGGVDIQRQIRNLKNTPHVLIATPGRLLDLMRRRAVNLSGVKKVVLDEADEMLNMGFKEDIDNILEKTHDSASIWLFSATMAKDVRAIVNSYMSDPYEVAVNTKQKTNTDISHQYVVTKTGNKLSAIRRFLELYPAMRGVMFCRTKRETQEIANQLSEYGFGVEALHGDLSQNQRDAVMSKFKSRSMQLLIATDVAARGIDVAELSHVFHHKLPDQPENYTHRSGRTGRAGKKGISIAFINPRENRKIRELEKLNNITFELIEVPTKSELQGVKINNWANLILETKVDELAEKVMPEVADKFYHLSKEDLLKRLISTQLDHLMSQDKEAEDINEYDGKKPNVSSKNETERYFINVGAIDGVTAGDLVHFLSDITSINRKQFSNFSIQKNCSFFDLRATEPLDFDKLFEYVEVNGRSIRVNRDVDTPKRKGRGDNKSRTKQKRSHFSADPVSRKGRNRSKSKRKGRR